MEVITSVFVCVISAESEILVDFSFLERRGTRVLGGLLDLEGRRFMRTVQFISSSSLSFVFCVHSKEALFVPLPEICTEQRVL